jgi:quercetin dioxygenase-like cupin family protein
MAVVLVGLQYSKAAEQEYIPKAKTSTLVETPLAGVEGKSVIIKHFEFPPGYVGGKHSHTGPVFVYVLEGKLTIDTKKSGSRSISAGELYQEPIGVTMQALNLSVTEPTKIVVFQVSDEEKPMMIQTK